MMKCIALLVTLAGVFCADPPEKWQENWLEHKQMLTRHYFDGDVAVYFDKDVNKAIKWMNGYLRDVWAYTKRVYGPFGDDKRLYAIFHAGRYSGGHPATYFDSNKSYRNVIDCGLSNKDAWKTGKGQELSIPTHEVSHIVEGASKGVHNSPAFPIWGDSKWAEIYIYDVYKALGRQADLKDWYDAKMKTSDNFPRANTYWFRDWFFPIYSKHGGAQALNRFFDLLAKNFPKNKNASKNRPQYTRNMNHGEFFHFWSGAAKTNLKSLASKAFGWNTKYENEWNKARKDFPNVKY